MQRGDTKVRGSLRHRGFCLPQVLKELRVFGVHDMAVPPSKCLLYRSVDARELFTQPCLLGTSLQCIKGEPWNWAGRDVRQAEGGTALISRHVYPALALP